MNRPIEFRVWDKEVEKMLIPDYIYMDGTVKLNIKDYSHECSECRLIHLDRPGIRPASTVVLMQYVGLKDKNNVKIYEGDIVKVAPTEGFYTGLEEVFWNDYGCFEPFVLPNDITYSSKNNKECEVVGNIYQHPELLKG